MKGESSWRERGDRKSSGARREIILEEKAMKGKHYGGKSNKSRRENRHGRKAIS